MENIYIVLEFSNFEFWGTLSECRAYIAANDFKDAQFTILEA